MSDEVWRGEATAPGRLADQIAEVQSQVLQLPSVEALEIVTIQCSAANRDLIVAALRLYQQWALPPDWGTEMKA